MAYVGAGGFAKVHLGKRWEVGADLDFRHYSNGRLKLPNEALNAVGGGLFARYSLSEYDPARYRKQNQALAEFTKGMQYTISVGGGVHTCQAEWNKYAFDHRRQISRQESLPRKRQQALKPILNIHSVWKPHTDMG